MPAFIPRLLLICTIAFCSFKEWHEPRVRFDFYGDTVELDIDASFNIPFPDPLSADAVIAFFEKIDKSEYAALVDKLLSYRQQYKLDDWLYYQLIRKTAQSVSPKQENYIRYTLYKWFLLGKSGYNTRLRTDGDKLLFYVQSDETIYEIPYLLSGGKQFVCLNYHDYGNIDFDKVIFSEIPVHMAQATRSFSYRIRQLPHFRPEDYLEKELLFNIYQTEYRFKIKLNPEIKTLFANYPVVDYESYLNIPLSRETYSSLIPLLKKNIKGMNVRNGVDYLMQFTRHAFAFERDSVVFGKEKRLSPEQTLLYDNSDCEDRVALLFYLVKEIYDLPMIVLSYPRHVTLAVGLDKPVGKPVNYRGRLYSVCEPTPQKQDLRIGELIPELRGVPFEIVYSYTGESRNGEQ